MGDGGGERWRRRSDRYWALTAFCGFGLTTWLGFLYVGVRSGRRAWQLAAALYGVGAVVIASLAVTQAGWPVLAEWLLLLALWGGGSAHAVVANRRWVAWLVATSPAPGAALEEPWATFVRHADSLHDRFRSAAADVVADVAAGPVAAGVRDLVADVERSVELVRRLAGHGQVLVTAWQGIDVATVDAGLATARSRADERGRALVEALEAQRAAADRINQVIAEVIDGLRRIDARLGEVVARVEELAARDAGEVVVVDLTALRTTLDEVTASGLATPGPPGSPG